MNDALQGLAVAAVMLAVCIGLGYCQHTNAKVRLLESETALNQRALESGAVKIR